MVVFYALAAFLMTLAGGAFALYYRRYLLFIMGFSAGMVIGVVFIDLLPEVFESAINQKLDPRGLMVVLLAGFVAIFLLEKLTVIHGEKQHDAPGHRHNVGLVGAIGLSFHSLLDGLAIGVSFRSGTTVGLVVLLAVVAHDFADGLNTVSFMLATRNSTWRTVSLLVVNALAPVLGATITLFVPIAPWAIAYQLAFFAGFLLYLGASDLLPEVHHEPRTPLIAVTIGGLFFAGAVVTFVEKFTV